MPNKKNHWISQLEDGSWADKREGNSRASGIYGTQREAFDAAHETAKQEGGEVFIKGTNGKIRERNTYGNPEPLTPRGYAIAQSARITSITIENFKGISTPVTVSLRPITLLFGKNSAGKSTILQAMQYALEVIRTGKADIDKVQLGGDAINLGGFKNIVHKHELDRTIRIKFDMNFKSVDWHTAFPIKEYIGGNKDTQDDLSAIGNDIETGWIELCIGCDKDEFGYAAPYILNCQIGLDGVVFADIKPWFDVEYAFATEDLDQSQKGKLLLNQQHPVLLLPGETPDNATNNIYAMLVPDSENYIWDYFYIDYIKKFKFSLDHNAIDSSLKENLSKIGCENESDKVPDYKLQNCTDEDDFIPGSFECFYDSRIEAVVEMGMRKDNRIGVFRAFHFNPERGWNTDFDGFNVAPVIESMNGNMPNYTGKLKLGAPVLDLLDNKNNKEHSDRNLYADVLFIEQMLHRLTIGPVSMLAKSLESMLYIGPIREIPSRNHQVPISKDESRWSNGLAAWDKLYSAIPPEDEDSYDLIGRVNGYLRDVLNLGYEIRRDDTVAINANHEILDLLDNLYEEQASLFQSKYAEFREYMQNCPTSKRLYLYDLVRSVEVAPHDIGVGVSQVLPVVVGAIANTAKGGLPSILSIEQPELHIHPAVQCALGDLFIREKSNNRIFLIETHSEHLLLRIMKRMRQTMDKNLPTGFPETLKDDVSVQFIENVDDRMIVRNMPLNERGELVKAWPGGFFEEGLEEVF